MEDPGHPLPLSFSEGYNLADTYNHANMLPICFLNDLFYVCRHILAKIFNKSYYVLPSEAAIKHSMGDTVLKQQNMKTIMYRCPRCNRVKHFSVWKHLNREELDRLNYVDVEFKFVRCDMC